MLNGFDQQTPYSVAPRTVFSHGMSSIFNRGFVSRIVMPADRWDLAATFNRAGSSNPEGVRMKVRQAYEGRVIEARSSELKDGGWDSEFSIEEHEATGVTERAFYVPGIFPWQRPRFKRQ
jgi:hypothetical protein